MEERWIVHIESLELFIKYNNIEDGKKCILLIKVSAITLNLLYD